MRFIYYNFLILLFILTPFTTKSENNHSLHTLLSNNIESPTFLIKFSELIRTIKQDVWTLEELHIIKEMLSKHYKYLLDISSKNILSSLSLPKSLPGLFALTFVKLLVYSYYIILPALMLIKFHDRVNPNIIAFALPSYLLSIIPLGAYTAKDVSGTTAIIWCQSRLTFIEELLAKKVASTTASLQQPT